MISAGEVHLPGPARRTSSGSRRSRSSPQRAFANVRPAGVKVHAGAPILELGLEERGLRRARRRPAVSLIGEVGLGSVKTGAAGRADARLGPRSTAWSRRSTPAARRSRARARSARTSCSRRGRTSSATSTAARPRCPTPTSSAGRDRDGDRDRPLRQRARGAPRDRPRARERRPGPGDPRQRRAVGDRRRAARDPADDGPPRLARRRRAGDRRRPGDRQHRARPPARDRHRSPSGREADIALVDAPIGSAADTALGALAIGDLPGVGMVLIDGSRSSAAAATRRPPARVPEVVKGSGPGGGRPLAPRAEVLRPMHFGLRLPSFALGDQTASLAEMGAYLRRAEDLGFDSAMLIDHLLVAPPAYRTTWLEPITLLAALVRRHPHDPASARSCWCCRSASPSSSRSSGRRSTCCRAGARSSASASAGWRREFEAVGIPHRERGARMNELLELITALWTQETVTYEGRFYRSTTCRSTRSPPSGRTRRSGSAAGRSRPRRSTARRCRTVEPVLRRIAKYAKTWVPHSSATAEMVDRDWDGPPRLHGRVRAAGRTTCRRSTRTSCTSSSPASAPSPRRRCSASTRAWTSTYWQEFYLLGEAEAGRRADPGQDRGAGRRRPPDPQPARLGS